MHTSKDRLHKLLKTTTLGSSILLYSTLPGAHNFEFRGYMSLGNQKMYHIVDTENASAYWIKNGQSRGDTTILNYNPETKEVCILNSGAKTWVKLTEDISAATGTLHYTSLSPSNKQLLNNYKQFIRPLDNSNGTTRPDATFEHTFERFIRQNPKRSELHRFLSQNSSKIDLKALANASHTIDSNPTSGQPAVMLGRKRGPTVGTTQWATKPETPNY